MPSKLKRVNLTLDHRLYSLTAETARLYKMPVSTFITHLLASSANSFPQLIALLSKKEQLDELTAVQALAIMPAFHLELGANGGRPSTYAHTLAARVCDVGGSDNPRACNTGVVLDNRPKNAH